jgi:hypothetical protein
MYICTSMKYVNTYFCKWKWPIRTVLNLFDFTPILPTHTFLVETGNSWPGFKNWKKDFRDFLLDLNQRRSKSALKLRLIGALWIVRIRQP